MELTGVTNFRRAVLTGLAEYTWNDELPKKVYDILANVVTEDMPRVRCCVHKERAVLKNRIDMALGVEVGLNIIHASKKALNEPLNRELPIIDVLPEACDQCPIDKFIVTDACRHCVAHKCMVKCPKKAISIHQNRAYIDKTKCIECGMCKKVCPFGAIIEVSRPCERACVLGAIHAGADRKAKIDPEKCVQCGACRSACPFGAIDERSNMVQVIRDIKAGKKLYALLAPSFVGQLGFKVTPGQVVGALLKAGFTKVEEVALGADLTAVHEAEELQTKLTAGQKYMTSSCCPSFVALIQKHLPHLAENISETVSPMVACGRLVKEQNPDVLTVFIGPCISKKAEARKNLDAIDYVLTFEELSCMLKGAGIDVETIEPVEFESKATSLGKLFPTACGVKNAVVNVLGAERSRKVKTHYAAGLERCFDELKKVNAGDIDCEYFEGMACDRGCMDGPGSVVDYNIVNMLIKKYAAESENKNFDDDTFIKELLEKIDMEVK